MGNVSETASTMPLRIRHRRRGVTRDAARAQAPLPEENEELSLGTLPSELRERRTERDASLTLDTICECGHARRAHRGLEMASKGACLECECAEFKLEPAVAGMREAILRRLRAMVEQVERLQSTA